MWRVACADNLEKQRGIFPLFREWMRREMNSAEASQFVTIEQCESRLEDSGTKHVQFLAFPCLCAPSLFCPSPPFPAEIWQQKPKPRVHLLIFLESSVEVGLNSPVCPDGAAGEDGIDLGIRGCS